MDAPNRLFLANKRKLIKQLGKKALYGSQIEEVCSKEFKKSWRGCNSQDTIQYQTGYQIINVDTSDKGGTHWVALYITGKTVYVFDSFGRPTPKLLKILTRQAKMRNIKLIDSERDPEQFGYSEICGQLSISWLMVVRALGIRQALKI